MSKRFYVSNKLSSDALKSAFIDISASGDGYIWAYANGPSISNQSKTRFKFTQDALGSLKLSAPLTIPVNRGAEVVRIMLYDRDGGSSSDLLATLTLDNPVPFKEDGILTITRMVITLGGGNVE